MQRHHRFLSAFILLILLAVQSSSALAAPGDTTRVSVSSSGGQGNDWSDKPSISGEGRYVVFTSRASNLVSGDTNGTWDVFVHDRITGNTARISVDSSGRQANAESPSGSISFDGRFVVFNSFASNLVTGDTNGGSDVFVHDRHTGTTTRVSVDSSGGQANAESYSGSISSDGRYVVFNSHASNLVSGDTNGDADVFVHDRNTGTTTRVSVDSSGVQGNSVSFYSSISGDGRYIAFHSYASNLVSGDTNGCADIFVHDRATGQTRRVSVDSSGGQGNNDSDDPSLSFDGRYVVFDSVASNLVNGDTNGTWDIFMHDSMTGITTRVSVDSSGIEGNKYSSLPSISADGRYVAFLSAATNLISGDTNGYEDIFMYDNMTGNTMHVSIDSNGRKGNGPSYFSSISSDGRYVAFNSWSNNLVSGDTNRFEDVFVHEMGQAQSNPIDQTENDPKLPATGFAPNRVTLLPPQTIPYARLGDLWLDIPKLSVKMPIVGVPKTNNEWDVSWLGANAGWLEGSAYPTWNGNSVLTGHVWNADNSPGLFVSLNTLRWGDKVIVHLSGQQYIYEVRSVKQVSPTNIDAMMKHEKLPWLTLVSCKGYDEKTGEYQYRILVRAVLVKIQKE